MPSGAEKSQQHMQTIVEEQNGKRRKSQITYTRTTSYKRQDTITTEYEDNVDLGKQPVSLTCQFCCRDVKTIVEEKSAKAIYSKDDWTMNNCGYVTMLMCAPIWLFIPCCYLFSRKPWRMTTHTCPSCNVQIGVFCGNKTRLFRISGTPEVQYAELKKRRMERRSSM